ncbi:MAG: 3'-5' exonuclease, partial [Sedimenticolaceae bacterium]
RQWVESIWLMLGGLAIAGPGAAADAQSFLRLLEEHEEAGGLIDFAQLETALSRLYAAPDSRADGRIQLMTMHKSKGLEFDTVILPGLGRLPASDSNELLYWLERTGSTGETQLLMAPIRAAGEENEAISGYLRELNKDKNRLETARLLYVAATRAKRRLHLLGHIGLNARGPSGKPAAGCLLEKLWPVVEADFADFEPPAPTAEEDAAPGLRELQRLAADWRPAIDEQLALETAGLDEQATDARIEFAWAGDTARHVGTLVHRQLQRIANEGIDEWPAMRIDSQRETLRRGLCNLGVQPGELDTAVDKTLRALHQTLAHDTGRWILAGHRDARCELPLTLLQDQPRHFVIDRTFIDEQGTRWIVDYKTGEHLAGDRAAFLDQEQARYREQLETYGRILCLLEDRPIRLALYFPMFPDWRVWDYGG